MQVGAGYQQQQQGEGQQPLIGTSERPIDDENGTNEISKIFV